MTVAWVVTGLLAPALSALAADVSGQVIITKQLTRKTVGAPVYNLRGPAPLPPATPKDGANEFARTVVILESQHAPAAAPVTAVLEQKGGRFEPDLLVVPVGSTVEFPNFDPIFHNVFSLSGAQPFDLGYYPKGQSRSVKFHRKGIVQVYCHIHSNMYSAIVVTSSPWYARPEDDGTFSWSGIPAGHYRLVAWHKIAGQYAVDVEVPETGTAHVKIQVPVDAEPHP